MDHNENQGRGDRPQLPEGSGIVYGAIVGTCCWFVLLILADAARSAW